MFNNCYNGRCDILLYISFLFLRIEYWVFLEGQFQGNNYTDWNLRSAFPSFLPSIALVINALLTFVQGRHSASDLFPHRINYNWIQFLSGSKTDWSIVNSWQYFCPVQWLFGSLKPSTSRYLYRNNSVRNL